MHHLLTARITDLAVVCCLQDRVSICFVPLLSPQRPEQVLRTCVPSGRGAAYRGHCAQAHTSQGRVVGESCSDHSLCAGAVPSTSQRCELIWSTRPRCEARLCPVCDEIERPRGRSLPQEPQPGCRELERQPPKRQSHHLHLIAEERDHWRGELMGQGHAVSKGKSQDSNPCGLALEPVC